MFISPLFLSISPITHLPGADAVDPLSEGPLVHMAQLERVAADLDDVVEEGTEAGQGIRRGEERHIPELDEHLQVVLEGAFVLGIGKISIKGATSATSYESYRFESTLDLGLADWSLGVFRRFPLLLFLLGLLLDRRHCTKQIEAEVGHLELLVHVGDQRLLNVAQHLTSDEEGGQELWRNDMLRMK